jgi:hypothetical protein
MYDCPEFSELMALWGRETPAEDPDVEPEDLEHVEPFEDEAALMMPPASHDAIKRAAKRWNDFVAVTNNLDQQETTEAGYVFAAALGLEGPKLEHAVECLKLWTKDECPSQGTMGLFLGLLIADEAKLEWELEGPEIG